MPTFAQLSKEQIAEIIEQKHRGRRKSQREKVLKLFMEQLQPLAVGEGLEVAKEEGENRQTVKNRLQRAAGRLDYEIEFIRSRGVIRLYRSR
ncbi:MAG: hypothetical protein GXP37_04350 [Chloroflexi bacterium]|nr:hypothetical protein [Chloroflexota bacterium]